jgi:putative addiction module component (TIGR02574 family)
MTLPEALRALPPDEKLALVTELWDELAASAPLALPSEEIAEMQRRRDESMANERYHPLAATDLLNACV